MRKINTAYIILLIVLAATFQACEKNDLRLTQYSLPEDKAYVRFALLSPGTPSVMIKINDVKINGSTTSGSSGIFPAVVNSPDYAAVAPQSTMRLSLANVGTNNDSILLFTGQLPIDPKKFYTVVMSDTGTNRTVFAIEDRLGALPDTGFFNLRFINAMAGSDPLSLIRIDSTSATQVNRDTIARNVTYKTGTQFIKQSISPMSGFSFIRYRMVTSTGVPIGTVITPPASALLNQRSTTIYAAGFANGTAAFAPTFASFGFVYNQ